jgi:phosphomannomutase
MSDSIQKLDLPLALSQLDAAAEAQQLSVGAQRNIRSWLTQPRYAKYAPRVADHLRRGLWKELDDVFWTIIPFGTGGRRGRMYPIGSNAINERTIGESAQGLAQYVLNHREQRHEPDAESDQPDLACAIAYDTRHRSREFAELCASIMVAHGFHVYLLEPCRSTPELSFLVRYKRCACGIMVTASHNPPEDNAVKVYWSTGGQVLPPHDRGIIEQVGQVDALRQADFGEAVADGRIELCRDEVDRAYQVAVLAQRMPGPRDLRIIYSPLHGVGASSVVPLLSADGFENVEVYAPHEEPDGDFPNVPNHVANPENPQVFDQIIEHGRRVGAELILATDPDCDRMGCAAPVRRDPDGPWATLDGNQIGALLTDFVLEQRRAGGQRLAAEDYVVTTLVTTRMIQRIAESYGVTTYGDLLVGFKWICGEMDRRGPERFVLGTEESHGYLTGHYVRDKDGGLACVLMAELAARVKAEGKSLHEKLESLYWQHGYHAERLRTIPMPGSAGMAEMESLMQRFRRTPPAALGGLPVVLVRDYQQQLQLVPGGSPQPLPGPQGDLVILDLAESGNYVAVRPSGTEPKVKMYMFTHTPAELLADLDLSRDEMAQRMDDFESDLRNFVAGQA